MAKKKTRKRADTPYLPELGSFPEYLDVIAQQLAGRYEFVKPAGQGRTGIAYQIRSIGTQRDFCLKTVRPAITDLVEREGIRLTLQKESQILSPLTHRCLPTIYETHLNGELPFYICSYHPGVTCLAFRKAGKKLTLDSAVTAIWSLIDVLEYLHGEGRTHCDLHMENILIHEEIFRHGILVIDFSSGHRESDSSPNTENRGMAAFKDAKGQASHQRTVNRLENADRFRHADYKALGMLLNHMKDIFFGNATTTQQIAYDDFARSLVDGRFHGWEQIRDRFRTVITPTRALAENAFLFLSEHGRPQSIPLPCSHGVPVGAPSLKVINTSAFQRLRGLRQLSFCDFYFPGASHTRFEHSIGVFGIGQRAIQQLVHDRVFREEYSAEECKAFLLGCLLHDIGHYPNAHVIEQYAASRFPTDRATRQLASHETHGYWLLNNDKELRTAIESHWGEGTTELAIKVLSGKTRALSELLDGPIDVDKIDYLTRDASHCGVPFGAGLDVVGLLASLRCLADGRRLGISVSGVPMVEGIMILQDQMLSHVYWNENARALICMFHAILAHLVGSDKTKFESFVQKCKSCRSDAEAMRDVVVPMVHEVAGKGDSRLSKMVQAFVNPSFSDVYVAACAYWPNEETPRDATSNIYDAIVRDRTHTGSGTGGSQLPIQWNLVKRLRNAYIQSFKQMNFNAEKLDIVIDVPYGKAARRPPVVEAADGGEPTPITEVSHLNVSIFERPAAFLSPVRVYVAPELRRLAGDRLQNIIVDAGMKFFHGGDDRADPD